MSIRFVALETTLVKTLQDGAPDANDQPAERIVSTGPGYPCRHCLQPIAAGEPVLLLAHRPFPARQPYAEVGPIFLHAAPCPRGGGSLTLPAMLASPRYIVRGYGKDHRIVYGTGGVVETPDIAARAAALLVDSAIAHVDVRSAANNCYQCRIERA